MKRAPKVRQHALLLLIQVFATAVLITQNVGCNAADAADPTQLGGPVITPPNGNGSMGPSAASPGAPGAAAAGATSTPSPGVAAGDAGTSQAGASAVGAGTGGAARDAGSPDSEAGSIGPLEPISDSGASALTDAGGMTVAPVTCPANSTLPPGDSTRRTSVGARSGGMRTYIVHVPASYDGTKPVPLMVNFHPLFGTGRGQRTGSGWAALGDREGMITAFPDGYDSAWDIGNCCTSGEVDDLAFAKAIVSEISASACIDPNRVYASGHSMGAGLSHLLACRAADVFAAVAPSAFDLTEENHLPCSPVRPITTVMHRSMSDPVVPYGGGATIPPNGTPVTVTMLGAVGTFDAWSRINECTDQAMAQGSCRKHSQCRSGVEVVLCNNSGHTEGPANVIWDVLKRHGLRGPL